MRERAAARDIYFWRAVEVLPTQQARHAFPMHVQTGVHRARCFEPASPSVVTVARHEGAVGIIICHRNHRLLYGAVRTRHPHGLIRRCRRAVVL